jgi:large subunit ribosomal protein L29
MRIDEIREFTDDQLEQELENTYRSLQNLRFRLATKQLTNTSEVRATKKSIARLLTAHRERQLAEG